MKTTTLALLLAAAISAQAQEYTRGLGAYPGDPREYFGPRMRLDNSTYRNLALRRPAYHSGSYDYNLTAQLVTDGIKETQLPRWVATSTSAQGVLPRNEREWLYDGNWVTGVDLKGRQVWVQTELGGGDAAPSVDRLELDGSVQGPQPENQIWNCTVSTSDDAKSWQVVGTTDGTARPSGEIRASIGLGSPVRARFYRLEFSTGREARWRVNEVTFFNSGAQIRIAGPWNFTSAWMAAETEEQWVYVDLGTDCSFDRIGLEWIRRPADAEIQVSSDARTWRGIQTLGASTGLSDNARLARTVTGRYVRVIAGRANAAGPVVLSELEVWGRGGPIAQPAPAPAPGPAGRIELAGGNWKLQRGSLVKAGGEALSQTGFADDDWLVATVPGTVLTSYYNAGALPDPNFGDNQLMISDSFFHADFWYRNHFTAPRVSAGQHLWLHLDGVNWKAEVFFNGRRLGRIEGGFIRSRFDVTDLVRPGQENALAVRIERVANPGSIKEKTFENPDKNGGVLGADNPTYHATIGWDWIPTIRGRDTGLWNSVYLATSGPVTLEDPLVTTSLPLPDISRADVTLEVTLKNHDPRPAAGTLSGRFGAVSFALPVTIPASSEKRVKLEPATHPSLRIQNPDLWWPNGYGRPALHTVELRFERADGSASDSRAFRAGIRQFTYSEEGGALRMWINGRRFIPRGGNWGFPESMLRYRAREYDAAVRYHRDMNFTMIRNWVGQIGENEFYDACDRHGIVVWQDFWLANPWDGPDPEDNRIFLANVKDTILRIRTHPSIGLYCGRNEGYPPRPINDGIIEALAAFHPGIHYIPSSADDVVSGHGPYRAMPTESYFTQRATPKFHSEMGMPNIPTMDSLKLMMPESGLWPQGRYWGLHDFCLNGAQGGQSFIERIAKSYGGTAGVADWVTLAQFVNYEGYRAMFEAQSRHRMGLLIWMSHPAWPSFVWQTYDYYLEPTAAYFASKKASEPLHIQWNPSTDNVEVVNYNGGARKGLTANAELLNLDGSTQWQGSATLDSPEDSTAMPLKIETPATLSTVHFIRLSLSEGGRVVSENLYWRGTESGNFQALRGLPKVTLDAASTGARQGENWVLTVNLANVSPTPVLMAKVKVVRAESGDLILPALYSDNYVTLMPGEKRTIAIEFKHCDTRGEAPQVVVEGFNTTRFTVR